MSEQKAIYSWNPWHGCTRYSEGCKHCYVFVLDKKFNVPQNASLVTKTKSFNKPLQKHKNGQYVIPAGSTVQVNMTSDTFHEQADEWREEMWQIIRQRPDVTFYILTKRVERIAECLPSDWGEGYENVDLNITCENQQRFDERWAIFKDIPAKHKGMTLQPLLGPIDITPALASGQIEHVNLGGEEFGTDTPCHYEWVKQVSDDCRRFGVPFWFIATGAVFVKDGKTYRIPNQKTQLQQAKKSGLSLE